MLWYRTVQWSKQRISYSLVVVAISLAVSLILGFLVGNAFDQTFGAVMGSIIAPLLWLLGTIFVWQETGQERADRLSNASVDTLVCPTCGYNLTGLSELRCPECGSKFTLSELVAAQPKRQLAAMDNEVGG
jgi:hypothetical protein